MKKDYIEISGARRDGRLEIDGFPYHSFLQDPVPPKGRVLEEVDAHAALDVLVLAHQVGQVGDEGGHRHVKSLTVCEERPFILSVMCGCGEVQ